MECFAGPTISVLDVVDAEANPAADQAAGRPPTRPDQHPGHRRGRRPGRHPRRAPGHPGPAAPVEGQPRHSRSWTPRRN